MKRYLMTLAAACIGAAAAFGGTVDYDVVTNAPMDFYCDVGVACIGGEELEACLDYRAMLQYGIVSLFVDHDVFGLMHNLTGTDADNALEPALYSDFTVGASVNIPLFATTTNDRIIYASDSTFNYFFVVPSETYHSINLRVGYNMLSSPVVHNVFLSGISFDYGFNASRQGFVAGLAWMSRRYIEVESNRHVYCSGELWQLGLDVVMGGMTADSVYGAAATYADGMTWRLFGELTGCSGKKSGEGNMALSIYFAIEKRPTFVVGDPYTERDAGEGSWFDGCSISLGLNVGYGNTIFRK